MNYCVLIAYLLALVAMGIYFSTRMRSTEDFFLGTQVQVEPQSSTILHVTAAKPGETPDLSAAWGAPGADPKGLRPGIELSAATAGGVSAPAGPGAPPWGATVSDCPPKSPT